MDVIVIPEMNFLYGPLGMCVLINPLIFFQTPPGGAFAVPQQIAVLIGHLTRDADFVAVEVVGLLDAFSAFGCPITYLRTAKTLRRDWSFHTGYGLL